MHMHACAHVGVHPPPHRALTRSPAQPSLQSTAIDELARQLVLVAKWRQEAVASADQALVVYYDALNAKIKHTHDLLVGLRQKGADVLPRFTIEERLRVVPALNIDVPNDSVDICLVGATGLTFAGKAQAPASPFAQMTFADVTVESSSSSGADPKWNLHKVVPVPNIPQLVKFNLDDATQRTRAARAMSIKIKVMNYRLILSNEEVGSGEGTLVELLTKSRCTVLVRTSPARMRARARGRAVALTRLRVRAALKHGHHNVGTVEVAARARHALRSRTGDLAHETVRWLSVTALEHAANGHKETTQQGQIVALSPLAEEVVRRQQTILARRLSSKEAPAGAPAAAPAAPAPAPARAAAAAVSAAVPAAGRGATSRPASQVTAPAAPGAQAPAARAAAAQRTAPAAAAAGAGAPARQAPAAAAPAAAPKAPASAAPAQRAGLSTDDPRVQAYAQRKIDKYLYVVAL